MRGRRHDGYSLTAERNEGTAESGSGPLPLGESWSHHAGEATKRGGRSTTMGKGAAVKQPRREVSGRARPSRGLRRAPKSRSRARTDHPPCCSSSVASSRRRPASSDADAGCRWTTAPIGCQPPCHLQRNGHLGYRRQLPLPSRRAVHRRPAAILHRDPPLPLKQRRPLAYEGRRARRRHPSGALVHRQRSCRTNRVGQSLPPEPTRSMSDVPRRRLASPARALRSRPWRRSTSPPAAPGGGRISWRPVPASNVGSGADGGARRGAGHEPGSSRRR